MEAKSKIKLSEDSVSNESPLFDSEIIVFLLSQKGIEGRELFGASLMALIHPHDIITSQRSHLQISSHWGLGC